MTIFQWNVQSMVAFSELLLTIPLPSFLYFPVLFRFISCSCSVHYNECIDGGMGKKFISVAYMHTHSSCQAYPQKIISFGC